MTDCEIHDWCAWEQARVTERIYGGDQVRTCQRCGKREWNLVPERPIRKINWTPTRVDIEGEGSWIYDAERQQYVPMDEPC